MNVQWETQPGYADHNNHMFVKTGPAVTRQGRVVGYVVEDNITKAVIQELDELLTVPLDELKVVD